MNIKKIDDEPLDLNRTTKLEQTPAMKQVFQSLGIKTQAEVGDNESTNMSDHY